MRLRDVTLAVRSRSIAIGAFAAGMAAVGAIAAIPLTNGAEQQTPASIAYFAWMVFFVTLGSFFGWVKPTRSNVDVVARRGELVVQGRMPRRFERGKATTLSDGRAQVELSRWPRCIRLEVLDVTTARDLLRQLGLDGRAGISVFRVAMLRRWPEGDAIMVFIALALATLSIAAGNLAPSGSGALTVAGAMIAAGAATLFAWSRRLVHLTIGADGIEMKRVGSRRLFISHTEIRELERVDARGRHHDPQRESVAAGVRIVFGAGKQQQVFIDTRPERFNANVWKTDPIVDLLLSAREAAAKLEVKVGPEVLARGERSGAAWIASLRSAAQEGTRYRLAAIDLGQLFDVLGDPKVSRELRVAAAISVGASAEHGPRLRAAADTLADHEVRRIALAAADRDDAALERHVEDLVAKRARIERR